MARPQEDWEPDPPAPFAVEVVGDDIVAPVMPAAPEPVAAAPAPVADYIPAPEMPAPPVPTLRQVLDPAVIRGNERVGSGGVRLTVPPPQRPHYQTVTPQQFAQMGNMGNTSLRARARQHAINAGIDPDIFERQIEAESNFDIAPSGRDAQGRPLANHAGARGIAQIVSQWHPGVDPDDPEAALAYAARLMASHLRNYGGDYSRALAAYNAGPGAVASGAAFTYPETQGYIAKIMRGGRPTSAQPGTPAPPPERESIYGAAFPDRLEDSPALDGPLPPRTAAGTVPGTALPDPGLGPAGQVHDPRLLQGPSQLGSAIGSGLDAILQAARGTPVLGLGLEAAGTAVEHVLAPAAEQSKQIAGAIAGRIASTDPMYNARFNDLSAQIAGQIGLPAGDWRVQVVASRKLFDEMPEQFNVLGISDKAMLEAVLDPFNLVGLGYEGAALRVLSAGANAVPRGAWWAVGKAESAVMGRQTAGLGAGFFAKYPKQSFTAGRLRKDYQRELLGLDKADPAPPDIMAELRKIADDNDQSALRVEHLGPGGGIQRSPVIAEGIGQSEVPTRTGSRPNVVGSSVSESPALVAYRDANVRRYRGIAVEYDKAAARVEEIGKDPLMEWGALSPEEQLVQLVIKESDGAWEGYLAGMRGAQTAEERAEVIAAARAHGEAMEHMRNGTQPGDVPFGNGPLLVGDSATTLLAEKEVQIAKMRELYKQGREVLATAAAVPNVPQRYTVRAKVIKGDASTRRFEIIGPDGRVFAPVTGKALAQRRAGELNLAAANEMIPGTPTAAAPDLVLENETAGVWTGTQQAADDAAAKAAATPGGEQQGLDIGTPAVAADAVTGSPHTATVYRGNASGFGDAPADGSRHYTSSEGIAKGIYGKGSVEKVTITFQNPLVVQGSLQRSAAWAARKELGLPPSASSPELIAAARSQGYDGIVMTKTLNGDEYVKTGLETAASSKSPGAPSVTDLEARTRPRTAEPGKGAAILPESLAPTVERLARDYAVPSSGAPGSVTQNNPEAGRWVFSAYDEQGNLAGILSTKADGPQVVAVREDARRQGIATRLYDTATEAGVDVTKNIGRGGRTQAGVDFTESYRTKKIAEASKVFATDPAMDAKLAQERVGTPNAVQAAEAVAPIPGERFVFRDGAIFDTKLGKVDDILTERVPPSASKPGTKSVTGGERWAKWANKKVDNGEWREHQAAIPAGQKLVPEDAVVTEPTVADGEPPNKPPKKGKTAAAEEPEPRDLEIEGPDPVIWRVVDNADGTASLGRLDLDRGIVIKGEKFADRNAALITAEARNATDEAVTMISDTMDDLARALSREPQLALPSPGMVAVRRKASQAEATFLEKERNAARAEVEKARADYRRRLANDPGFGVTNPGLVPPKKAPKGTTPIPLRGRVVEPSPIADAPETAPFQAAPTEGVVVQGRMFDTPGEAARRSARDLLGGIPVGFSGASRALGTMLDIGTAFRQLAMFAVRHPRAWAHAMVEGGIRGYLQPGVAEARARAVFTEVMEEGGRALHFRGGAEFTGEAVKVPDIILKNPLVERSNASFNSSINLANGRVFLNIVRNDAKQAAKSGRSAMSQEDKDALAWVLNHQTGYGYDPTKLGDVGQFFHKAASMLYSTQWQASRFGVYGDLKTAIKNLATGNLRAADKEALSGGVMFAAANVTILATVANAMGVEVDFRPNSTNFAQVPIGNAGDPDMGARTAALSAVGVGVQTRNDGSVWADFSSGLGADIRLIAKMFPFGGDSGGLITGKSIGASGHESDPYNPGFGDRNALGIVIDWMTSRGDPRTRLATSVIDRFGGDDMTADESLLSALISSVIPMLIQDAADAAGLTENLRVESFMEALESVPSWFTGGAGPTPGGAPAIPAPAGGGLFEGHGSP